MNSPTRLSSPSGLSFECNANGSIRRIDHGDIMVNLFLGNEMDAGLANIYLRRLGESSVPLLGPHSAATFAADERGLFAQGEWEGIVFRVRLVLAQDAPAWFWHVELENTGSTAVTCDLIHTQDLGLAHYGAIRLNEYYVSQYVDHTALEHPIQGMVVASRQNQSMGGRCPWTIIGSLRLGVSYSTDARQFHGLATRAGGQPAALSTGLQGTRLQHEHSMVAVQDAPLELAPGAKAAGGFFGWLEPDKQTATSLADLSWIERALALPEARPTGWPASLETTAPARSLFTSAPLLRAQPLDDAAVAEFFGNHLRHEERQDGRLLSCFAGKRNHVVLQAKELMVLRPHGHVMRSGGALVPDESALTSTAWMGGVFHSMVTQGHVSINRFLSTCHTYLGLFRSHGQRVFVELENAWHLLDVPSAFEMAPDYCRWIYQHPGGVLEVISMVPDDCHELRLSLSVLRGAPVRFLISHHVSMNGDDGSGAIPVQMERTGDGVFVRAIPDSDVGRRFPTGGFLIRPSADTKLEAVGGDELLFADGVSRRQPFLCFVTAPLRSADLTMEGRLVESAPRATGLWESPELALRLQAQESSVLAGAVERTAEIFPWFIHNALVHYLSPRGLEQYSGGGWGTRDVCQGPVELLLALGHFAPIRDLLCRVFRQQNPDGDWPQWFMFFDRERNIRPGDSHGDIVYWPILALAQYLSATGDAGVLDECLPFFHGEGDAAAEKASVWTHVERALDLIQRRVIPGTHLAAYGHGDWNDSLQPARSEMRELLCSSWTVTLNYQTFVALAGALERHGRLEQASALRARAAVILEEFQRVLLADEVVAGFAYFKAGKTELLLHPRDGVTGLSYSVLPMIHAIINNMFTPAQAETHLRLIQEYLQGPDGARLFDRPLAYHGGPQKYFQRAESASFFGREIGIMYTHAHLRYCEALARFGDADHFFHALCQANPIGLREIVPSATLRQANCYYSSSDAAFADRYEALESYDRVKRGEVALEGGWRVYSSGAAIGVRLVMQCFLGLRIEQGFLVVDPIIPSKLDGLKAQVTLGGLRLDLSYRIQGKGCGPVSIERNGTSLAFERESNPYRAGAARVPLAEVAGKQTDAAVQMTVILG